MLSFSTTDRGYSGNVEKTGARNRRPSGEFRLRNMFETMITRFPQLAITVLCIFLISCGKSIEDVQEIWVSDISPGETTRRQILLRSGVPKSIYQGEDILFYKDGSHDVIFVFDENGVLSDYKVRERSD